MWWNIQKRATNPLWRWPCWKLQMEVKNFNDSSSQQHNTNFPGELPSWSLRVFLSFIFFPLYFYLLHSFNYRSHQNSLKTMYPSLWRPSSPLPREHPSSTFHRRSDPCVTLPRVCCFNYTPESRVLARRSLETEAGKPLAFPDSIPGRWRLQEDLLINSIASSKEDFRSITELCLCCFLDRSQGFAMDRSDARFVILKKLYEN